MIITFRHQLYTLTYNMSAVIYLCTIRLIEPTAAWQNSNPVLCKMHAFFQNAISFKLYLSDCRVTFFCVCVCVCFLFVSFFLSFCFLFFCLFVFCFVVVVVVVVVVVCLFVCCCCCFVFCLFVFCLFVFLLLFFFFFFFFLFVCFLFVFVFVGFFYKIQELRNQTVNDR